MCGQVRVNFENLEIEPCIIRHWTQNYRLSHENIRNFIRKISTYGLIGEKPVERDKSHLMDFFFLESGKNIECSKCVQQEKYKSAFSSCALHTLTMIYMKLVFAIPYCFRLLLESQASSPRNENKNIVYYQN